MRPVVVALPMVLACAGCFEATLAVDAVSPVADAGFDQKRYLGSASTVTVDLDGRASCDPQGDTLSTVTWSVVEGPAKPTVTAQGALRGTVTLSLPGEYLVALRVTAESATSERRKSAPDYVVVTVVEGEGDDIVVRPPSTDACGRPLTVDDG